MGSSGIHLHRAPCLPRRPAADPSSIGKDLPVRFTGDPIDMLDGVHPDRPVLPLVSSRSGVAPGVQGAATRTSNRWRP